METLEFQGILAQHGGDGEEVWVKFVVSQSEVPKMQALLTWGKRVLTITVVKE